MQKIENIYRNLIERVLAEGVQIREDASLMEESPYQFKSVNIQPQIRLHRAKQPADAWVDKNSNIQRIAALIERNPRGLHEVIGVAHELGHHLAGDKTLEPIYDKLWTQKHLSPEEKAIVLQEENCAWSCAREMLSELNFENWIAFDAQLDTSLETYKKILVVES